MLGVHARSWRHRPARNERDGVGIYARKQCGDNPRPGWSPAGREGVHVTIQPTLLERLRNPGPPGERHLRVSAREVQESILRNLQNLLNTTQGNCLTDPKYGLPHMTSIQSAMPDSVRGFLASIKTTIERNEPRLKSLRVRHSPARDDRMELRFEISGLIVDENDRTSIRFETFIDDEGRMQVK